MYRAIIFIENPETTLTTSAYSNSITANNVLDTLLKQIAGATGGHIEQKIPGIGWVLEDEVETAQIIARRRED